MRLGGPWGGGLDDEVEALGFCFKSDCGAIWDVGVMVVLVVMVVIGVVAVV